MGVFEKTLLDLNLSPTLSKGEGAIKLRIFDGYFAFKKSIILLLVVLISACQPHEEIPIKDFNAKEFQSDRGGCNNNRIKYESILQKNKGIILGKSENEVFSTFGRYDFQILDKKNEKTFVYYLQKGPQCENMHNKSLARCFIVKINSVTLVKEIQFSNGIDLD